MTPAQGLAYFASLPASSIKMGLDRVQLALAALGHPEREYPALHVAGTNGKGSTCAFAASCLSQRYRVGLYTSPHLIRVNERIKLNGLDISDEVLGQRVAEVRERLPDAELTYFEFGTVVAFWHFAKEGIELAVLETGLGGRLDATTACLPKVTAITPISFDHQAYLGHTLTAIAAEKAGIAKPGVPMVLSRQPPEAAAVFASLEAIREGVDFQAQGPGFSYRGLDLRLSDVVLPLRGPHQTQNAAVALACLELLGRAGFPLRDEQIRRGLEGAQWPGRLEEFAGVPPVVLDGAHNPAGVDALLASLEAVYPKRPVHLVFGVFEDKDAEPMMRALFTQVAAVTLTPIANPRSRAPAQYVELARSLNAQVTIASDAESALAAARAATPKGGIVVVAGSLFLVGQLRAALVR